ncbi:LPXTG cell wall anchor domain-containing protein, partial [Thomasclavelia sp.]
NEVLGNVNAMQEEVDEVYTELVKAFVNLRLKPNKDLLNDLINKANGLNRANYTVASLKIVDEEAVKANKVLNDPEATKEQVEKAVATLTKAIAELEANPGSTVDGNTIPVKSGDTISVKTGDNSLAGVFVGVALLSMTTVLINYKRKE